MEGIVPLAKVTRSQIPKMPELRGTVEVLQPIPSLDRERNRGPERLKVSRGLACSRATICLLFLFSMLLPSLCGIEWNSTSVNKGKEGSNSITRSLNNLEPNFSFLFFLTQRPYVQKLTVQSTLSKTMSLCRNVFSHMHLKKIANNNNKK